MEAENNTKPRKLKFISIGGLQVYSPTMSEDGRRAHKHPCPDCHFCQFCSDIRCRNCRGAGKPSPCSATGESSVGEPVPLCETHRIEIEKNDQNL